ncbi:MAG: SH3 domain-containing protein [Bacteroidia bacterium]|nr:SH3 domain-containing protein [Bacteroidia bacterium]
MKNIFVFLMIHSSFILFAQDNAKYVAAKAGLNIREKPDVTATVLDKIPYATKIVLPETVEEAKKINTEGLTGYWRKVTYNNKAGYIIDSYLLPFPPPKSGLKTIKEYLAQLADLFGAELVIKGGDEETGYELHKQLYKNGGESHQYKGYEYGSVTYFLPELTMQQGFLILRMIPEFAEVLTEKDLYPTSNKKFKRGENEYEIKVEKETISDTPWIKRISIEFESGAIYSFEMYQIDNQLVIFYGSGV